ncbi:hypothetical protein CLOLEP_02589 [[Clostridium] leptum DSM 753]|uniref:Uncharacterized protein n=1 Tax=[Clostridium] leptum DSM 753 TaxID=428125 RepID=A7VVH7_9FIRM|nr:hypothetical protein CLOLEP_02589 [[Clostridium] leptum DSM 753]
MELSPFEAVACSGRQRRKTVLCDGNLAFEMGKPFCGC